MTDFATNDYETVLVDRRDLDETHVLVGESGGLCSVYGKPEPCLGELFLETEHGTLILTRSHYEVIA